MILVQPYTPIRKTHQLRKGYKNGALSHELGQRAITISHVCAPMNEVEMLLSHMC